MIRLGGGGALAALDVSFMAPQRCSGGTLKSKSCAETLGYVIRIYIKESGDSGNFVTQLTKLSPSHNAFISMQFSWQIMQAEGVSYLDRAAII